MSNRIETFPLLYLRKKIEPDLYIKKNYTNSAEIPKFNSRNHLPFSKESQQVLVHAKQTALKNQKDIVTTGDIFIGLLTLERQFDSKLSRVFQEYLPVEKAPNTFEQPNQQEQIQKASIKDTLLRLSTSLQEKFTVPIDIFGRIQFSTEAYLSLLEANFIMKNNNFHKKIEPADILAGIITEGYNIAFVTFISFLPRQGVIPSRDFHHLLQQTTRGERRCIMESMYMSVK